MTSQVVDDQEQLARRTGSQSLAKLNNAFSIERALDDLDSDLATIRDGRDQLAARLLNYFSLVTDASDLTRGELSEADALEKTLRQPSSRLFGHPKSVATG